MRKPQTTKSTIRNDPFATLIPDPMDLTSGNVGTLQAPPVEKKAIDTPRIANIDRKEADSIAKQPIKQGKQKLTVHLESQLADRVKNAAYWNPRLTIAGIAEQGIKLAIEKYEREHGGKYPPREGELVGGRPIK